MIFLLTSVFISPSSFLGEMTNLPDKTRELLSDN
jgi:hypothetical protein